MTTTDQHTLADVLEDLGGLLCYDLDNAARTRAELYDAVNAALEEGMTISEVARLAGLTRQTVYNVLKKEEK